MAGYKNIVNMNNWVLSSLLCLAPSNDSRANLSWCEFAKCNKTPFSLLKECLSSSKYLAKLESLRRWSEFSCNLSWNCRLVSPIKTYYENTLTNGQVVCLLEGSKSENKTAYAYSIDGSLVSHCVRYIAFLLIAELMTIFAYLSHLTLVSINGKFLLLTDVLSTLYSLLDIYN